jgi:hypothetical protein
LAQLNASYFGPRGCKEQEEACYAAGTGAHSDKICKNADDFCVRLTPFSCLSQWPRIHNLVARQCHGARRRKP